MAQSERSANLAPFASPFAAKVPVPDGARCGQHQDREAVALCARCGQFVCAECFPVTIHRVRQHGCSPPQLPTNPKALPSVHKTALALGFMSLVPLLGLYMWIVLLPVGLVAAFSDPPEERWKGWAGLGLGLLGVVLTVGGMALVGWLFARV